MMEVCVNTSSPAASSSTSYSCGASVANNNNTIPDAKPVRPKRDFRFKVIEVQNGPKWFVWPSRNRGSSEEVDENHNKNNNNNNNNNTTKPEYLSTTTAHVTQNGYGALRRSVVRQSKRKTDQDSIVQRTASEPASARRLSTKKEKAVTEPISQVSSMFKIISIEKNWESFDATDDEEDDVVEVKTVVSLAETNERRWTTSC